MIALLKPLNSKDSIDFSRSELLPRGDLRSETKKAIALTIIINAIAFLNSY
ncbi:hypothetical protein [Pleurocapsa sp. PCC 7319]|uniref:hypothetical protein n=1 Tax=Pleurocapsa sp. PCC 7319 TaxID=118161 RepID=UPI000347FF97|nr:hypothetical protein [Pleurocapsa sp. PCC 7319]